MKRRKRRKPRRKRRQKKSENDAKEEPKKAESGEKLKKKKKEKKKEAEERQKKEAEEREKKEAEERQKKEAEERQKKEAEERQKKEAEERQKKEAEERQKKEAEERQKKEAEERQKKEAEERQKKTKKDSDEKDGKKDKEKKDKKEKKRKAIEEDEKTTMNKEQKHKDEQEGKQGDKGKEGECKSKDAAGAKKEKKEKKSKKEKKEKKDERKEDDESKGKKRKADEDQDESSKKLAVAEVQLVPVDASAKKPRVDSSGGEVINSATHRKEYAAFGRWLENPKRFPAQLQAALNSENGRSNLFKDYVKLGGDANQMILKYEASLKESTKSKVRWGFKGEKWIMDQHGDRKGQKLIERKRKFNLLLGMSYLCLKGILASNALQSFCIVLPRTIADPELPDDPDERLYFVLLDLDVSNSSEYQRLTKMECEGCIDESGLQEFVKDGLYISLLIISHLTHLDIYRYGYGYVGLGLAFVGRRCLRPDQRPQDRGFQWQRCLREALEDHGANRAACRLWQEQEPKE